MKAMYNGANLNQTPTKWTFSIITQRLKIWSLVLASSLLETHLCILKHGFWALVFAAQYWCDCLTQQFSVPSVCCSFDFCDGNEYSYIHIRYMSIASSLLGIPLFQIWSLLVGHHVLQPFLSVINLLMASCTSSISIRGGVSSGFSSAPVLSWLMSLFSYNCSAYSFHLCFMSSKSDLISSMMFHCLRVKSLHKFFHHLECMFGAVGFHSLVTCQLRSTSHCFSSLLACLCTAIFASTYGIRSSSDLALQYLLWVPFWRPSTSK